MTSREVDFEMKTKQEQIEEMARVIRTWENVGDVNYRFGTHYAGMFYKAGYRKASDVIDEFMKRIKERALHSCREIINCYEVTRIETVLDDIANEMRQEVEK